MGGHETPLVSVPLSLARRDSFSKSTTADFQGFRDNWTRSGSFYQSVAFNSEEIYGDVSLEDCDAENIQNLACCRLMLAVYFDDEESMENMIDWLDWYECNPAKFFGHHLRLLYS